MQRLDAAELPFHSFRSCRGVREALGARFTRPEEDSKARKRLYTFSMGPNMSACDYVQEFERIADDISGTHQRDLLVHFIKGLPPPMQREVNIYNPADVRAAMDLVIRLGNPSHIWTAPAAPAASSMEVGSIGRGSSGGGSCGGGGARGCTPPNPRASPDWPK